MKTIHETDKLIIKIEYENSYLIEKNSGKVLMEDDFYGDPYCGLISMNNDWAIIAGEHLSIWTEKTKFRIEDEKLKWITKVELIDNYNLNIYLDNLSKDYSIWRLDIKLLELFKTALPEATNKNDYLKYNLELTERSKFINTPSNYRLIPILD